MLPSSPSIEPINVIVPDDTLLSLPYNVDREPFDILYLPL